MKVTITLEDTHDGLNMHIDTKANGVQDHLRDSLAFMEAARIENHLTTLHRQHALVLTRDETHAAY